MLRNGTPCGSHAAAGRAQPPNGVRNFVIVERDQTGMERRALSEVCDFSIELCSGYFVHPTARPFKTAVPRRERLTETNRVLELASGDLPESKNAVSGRGDW